MHKNEDSMWSQIPAGNREHNRIQHRWKKNKNCRRLRERSLTVLYKVHTLQGHSLTPEMVSLSTISLSEVLRLLLRPFFCALTMEASRTGSTETALLLLRFVVPPKSPVLIRPPEINNQVSFNVHNNSSGLI